MASTDRASTDIVLSDIDEIIGQGTPAGQVGPYRFSSKNMNIKIAPRKNFLLHKENFQKGLSTTLVSLLKL